MIWFSTVCSTNRICHLHNTLKNIPRKRHNYKKSFLRNLNKADACYHQSFILYVSESTDKNIMALILTQTLKVLQTQPFHCIPYLYETPKTSFQVLWIVSNLVLIWRSYRLHIYVCIGYVAIPSWEQWQLWHKDRASAPSTEAQDAAHSASFMRAETWSLHLKVGIKPSKVSDQHSWEWKRILKLHFTFQAKMSTGIIKYIPKAVLYRRNCCRSKGITVL